MDCFFFVSKPLTLVALFLILLFAPPSMADDDNNNNVKGGGVFVRDIAANSSQSPPPMSSENNASSVPFRPSMLVIVVALAGIFSVVFLVLLYAKHCAGGGVVVVTATPATVGTARKNSGIDRGVVESLPVFRFGSLRGQKEGLDCAVCLNRFDSNEVLRLLPKCKHAFHVECVDTWLDAHSTCPLCRYRVDPEDILLVDRNPPPESRQNSTHEVVLDVNVNPIGNKRFPGRHSSGGEKGILRSNSHEPMSLRRSLDSAGVRKKSQSLRAVGSYDYPRKDGLLSTSLDRGNSRVEHRIIVSSNSSRAHEGWSDAQPSDLLYLGSEMLMSDSRRFLSTSRSRSRQQQHNNGIDGNGNGLRRWSGASSGGRNTNINTINNNNNTVMNARSVSEITGFSRFPIKANRANSTH